MRSKVIIGALGIVILLALIPTIALADKYGCPDPYTPCGFPMEGGKSKYVERQACHTGGGPTLIMGKDYWPPDKQIGPRVYATADGNILYAGEDGVGTNHVKLDNPAWNIGYMHLDQILVHTGQKVKRGDLIGIMGNDGYPKYSAWPHLHYWTYNKRSGPVCDQDPYFDGPVYPLDGDSDSGEDDPKPTPKPTPEPTPPPKAYEPRPAKKPFAYDKKQPLAPMWKDLSPTIWWWRDTIYRWGKDSGINPNVIATIMQVESCGWPEAGSSAGAQGLFQVMPFHFPECNGNTACMKDVEHNAEKGIGYYSAQLSRANGDWILAAAAYNMGPRAFQVQPSWWPLETRRYVSWFSMVEDAFKASSKSEKLVGWLGVDGGRLCNASASWQLAHPREDNDPGDGYEPVVPPEEEPGYTGDVVTLDYPPFIYFTALFVLAGLLYWVLGTKVVWTDEEGREYVERSGYGPLLAKITLALMLVLYFPLNFGRLFTALEVGVLPYRNTSFVVRQYVEEHFEWLDVADDVYTTIEGLPDPDDIPGLVSWAIPNQVWVIIQGVDFILDKADIAAPVVHQLKETKDGVVELFRWFGKDPVLTPAFRFLSEQLQVYLIKPDVQTGKLWVLSKKEFESSVVTEDTPIALRLAEGVDGSTNPWGLHGEQCYSCEGLQSWLGTDVGIPVDSYIISPIAGKVERIILGGTRDIGGDSIWITSHGVRFAIIGIKEEDAQSFDVGDEISAGDKLARREGSHLHIVLELRNQDGSWGDYPLALLLDSMEVEYWTIESGESLRDNYVPTAEDLAKRSDYLVAERKDQ